MLRDGGFHLSGSQKEIIGYQSEVYSFTHNFLSELGSLQTNTARNDIVHRKKNNAPSILICAWKFIVGPLLCFYVQFKKVFVLIEDSSKAQFYAKITTPVGLLMSFFLGVGCSSWPSFWYPCIFYQLRFLTLFFLCILHQHHRIPFQLFK